MNEFKLNDLLGLSDQEQKEYKLHIAKYNGDCQPLDIFMDCLLYTSDAADEVSPV